jgi:hypothetical protein
MLLKRKALKDYNAYKEKSWASNRSASSSWAILEIPGRVREWIQFGNEGGNGIEFDIPATLRIF